VACPDKQGITGQSLLNNSEQCLVTGERVKIIMLESQKSQAAEAARQYRAAVASVQGDALLSEQGKAQRIAELQGEYNATVTRLQDEAWRVVARQRKELDGAAEAAWTRRAAALAGVLGEPVRYAILLEAVRELSPAEWVEMTAEAVDDWTRAVLLELGRARFSDPEDPEQYRAQRRLAELDGSTSWGRDVAAVGEQVKAVDEAQQSIAGLDVEHARSEMGARYGVRSDLLPE
jgi:hypothetical protein